MYQQVREKVASWLKDVIIDTCGEEVCSLHWLTNDLKPSDFGDLSSSCAFKLTTVLKDNPHNIAMHLAESLEGRIATYPYIEKVEVVGPYLNFHLSTEYCTTVVCSLIEEGKDYCRGHGRGKVIIEHTSANPDGPLHIGHIRNSVIGDVLARLHQWAGFDVETHYYVNDMGRQVAIVVWGMEHLPLPNIKPDHAIVDVYIKANRLLEKEGKTEANVDKLMQDLENGDTDVIKRFHDVVQLALSGISQSLERMGVHIDKFVYESEGIFSGRARDAIEQLKRTGRTFEKDGALMLSLEEFGIKKPLVLMRSNGTTLYATRDIAYHIWKAKYANKTIDILGADHKLVASQIRGALELLNIPPPEVVLFEFVTLPEGSMSTRKGEFISADDLMDEVVKSAKDEVDVRRGSELEDVSRQHIAELVGIGAMRYDMVKVSAEKGMVFDWRAALDFEKLGAPFIQYAHARACSILKKAKEMGFSPENDAVRLKDAFTEDSEFALIKKIGELDAVLERCVLELRPHHMAIYARELADAFNQFYRDSPVLLSPEGIRESRLAIVHAARDTLWIVLHLLGIQAPESM
ncbi:MAG: arginine--tRNA ligase [Methermicoccaceae archaeon]